jgi:formylglycine-generating enzyme required for sulfatase activity
MPTNHVIEQESTETQEATRLPHSPGVARAQTAPRRGLAARFFGWLAPRRIHSSHSASRREIGDGDESRASSPRRGDEDIHGMAKRLIAQDRYGFVLLQAAVDQVHEADARAAWQALNTQMALIPAGNVPVVFADASLSSVDLEAFYLDRCAVTNRQFQRFVTAGGYDDLEIWPSEVWPSVARFTDRSGRPGPRDWENGKFPPAKAEHPVVGVCWYEAVAYSRWVGKRLPTASEWQKAGGWPEQLSGGMCNRYPWGNMFEPVRTNLSTSGVGQTVAVREYPSGTTPNGIYQMTGNVWEWLDDPLQAIPCAPGEYFQPWKPMRRIIGGAYNTYFPGEATCQFITGQGELDRRENIGFRCALPLGLLRPLP